jgi:hypothetical protein
VEPLDKFVFSLTFGAKSERDMALSLIHAGLRNAKGQGVAASGTPATVEIRK